MVNNLAQKMLKIANYTNRVSAKKFYKQALDRIREKASCGIYQTYINLPNDEDVVNGIINLLKSDGFQTTKFSGPANNLLVRWDK